MKLRTIFTENLKYYRRKAGFTQQQFAEKCEIATNYLSEIEREQKFPSVEMIERLSSELKIPAYFLFMNKELVSDENAKSVIKKRDAEFSKQFISEVTRLLKEFGFIEN